MQPGYLFVLTDHSILKFEANDDTGAYQLDSANVVWAPDSRRFAFNYRIPASHALFETIAIYQLQGEKWVGLTLPLDPDSRKSQVAQLARGPLAETHSSDCR